jgi:hypothetical protein
MRRGSGILRRICGDRPVPIRTLRAHRLERRDGHATLDRKYIDATGIDVSSDGVIENVPEGGFRLRARSVLVAAGAPVDPG